MTCLAIQNMASRLSGLSQVINLARLLLFVCSYVDFVDLDTDPTCRFMLTAGGNRGWGGTTTEVVMGYDIGVVR